jgi:hypothetical protein
VTKGLLGAVAGRVAAEEGGNLVTIAADGHGAPAPAMCAGIVIEKEAAGGVGAAADGSARAFDEEFGGGAGKGGEEPIQAAFAGDELEGPGAVAENELIVTLGNAENFVDGHGPGSGKRFAVYKGSENGSERFAEPQDAQENSIDGLRFCGEKRPETSCAVLRDKASIHQERYEFIPGEIVRGGGEVGKIEREAASD